MEQKEPIKRYGGVQADTDYTKILEAWEEQKPQGRRGGKMWWLAIKVAIMKQIPVKPRIETTKEVPRTHNYGRLLYMYCPSCGNFIVGVYETDHLRGGGIHPKLNGCSTCLQTIDFSEWKAKPKEEKVDNGEVVFED